MKNRFYGGIVGIATVFHPAVIPLYSCFTILSKPHLFTTLNFPPNSLSSIALAKEINQKRWYLLTNPEIL